MEYVIGLDLSTGSLKGDWQVGQVLRRDTLDQVAVYKNRNDIGLVVQDIDLLGRYYNLAWICPERNAVGEAFIYGFVKVYPNSKIYHEDWALSLRRGRKPQVQKFGFYTASGKRSKQLLVISIQEYLRDNQGLLMDLETVEQMMEYQRFDLTRKALGSGYGGEKDDFVMAFGLALMMNRVLPPYQPKSQDVLGYAARGGRKGTYQKLSIGWPG